MVDLFLHPVIVTPVITSYRVAEPGVTVRENDLGGCTLAMAAASPFT